MTYRLRNIAIATALAVLAATLTSFYVRQEKQNLQKGQELATVYVANQDIEPGTSGSEVAGMVESREVATSALAPSAIVEPDQLEGKVVTQTIYSGEQVSELNFATQQASGIRAQLTGTLRALQVPGDANQLLAGTLKEGDHVDVVANLKYKFVNFNEDRLGTDENTAVRVILRDVVVLRGIGEGVDERLSENASNNSIIVAVTDAQAQKLFFAMQNGTWSLALRPTVDPADSPESVETVGTLLGDGLKGDQIAQLTGYRPKEGQ
jgi:Flp pilus assembly protein CpaB